MKYDYNEVLRKYKELSLEKGRPLTLEEVDKINELPSNNWFGRNGGVRLIREKLGLVENTANSQFCEECAYDPEKCGYEPEDCPLRDEADLYYQTR